MGRYELIAIAAGCFGAAGSAWAQQQNIDLIPRVIEGVRGSYQEIPQAMNFDGSVIVGRATFSDAPFDHPFRWHETEGMQAIAMGSPASGIAADVSSDGQTVIGHLDLKLFRWHQGTMSIHEPLGPGVPVTVHAGSCDGLKAVGNATSGTAAFLWSLTEGTTILQPAVPGHECRVLDLSGNGQVALGWDAYQENFPAGPATRTQIATWTNGGGATLMGGLRSDPGNISQNGSIVSGWACTEFINANNYPQCNGDTIRISRWINGAESVMVPFVPSQIMPGDPLAMSGDGTVIGGSLYYPPVYTLPRASIWRGDIGIVDLNTWLPTIGVNMNGWVLEYVTAVSADGSVLAGTGKYFGTQRAFRVKVRTDTDGDGLYDDWEQNGIPYAGPGCEVRRYILPDASPLRKDIYVEVDSMLGMAPSQAAINRVVAAFDQAPVPAVSAPGALPGINLHVMVDEATVVPRTYTTRWDDYLADKALHFGTITERADTYWPQIKEAKRQAYRYCIFAFELSGEALGRAELDLNRPAGGPRMGGNDISLGLGNYTPPLGVSYEDVQAATFMHELGHSLGLFHGGGDSAQINNPNHLSIMNYTWAGVRKYAPGAIPVLLDYSRYSPPDLNESALLEVVGINIGPGFRVPIVVRSPGTPGTCGTSPQPPSSAGSCDAPYDGGPRCIRYASTLGPVDWDNDGVISGNPVCSNVNNEDIVGDIIHGETLHASNEWLLIAYNFRDSIYYSDLAMDTSSFACPTYAYEQWASSLPPAPPIPCPGPAPTAAAPSPATVISCSGQPVTVTVAPGGTGPFTVQWRWRDDSQNPPVWVNFAQGPMTNGTIVDGAQSGTLKLTTPNAADFGASSVAIDYTVVDACGLSAASAAGQLQLGTLTIAQTSPAVVAACPGGNAVFSLSPDSAQFTYQWMSLAMSPVTFTNGRMRYGTLVSGASTGTLSFSGINPLDFPAGPITINCTLSGPCGSVTSPHFTFNPNGAVITTQPTDVNLACASAAQATFSVAATSDGPLTYQWKKGGAVLSNGGRISGATTATLTVANPVASDSGPYTCVVSSACAATTSNAAALNVGVPTLISTPNIPPVCLGGTAHFYATANGTQPLSYQWLRNGNTMNNGGGRTGTNTAHMTIANIAANDLSATYSVRVTNACGQVTSATASLTLYQSVTIGTQPTDQQTCPNGAATLTAAPAVNQAGLTYAWSVENPASPGTWLPLTDGPMVIAGSTCGTIVGAATGTLTPTWLYHAPCAPSYRFRCTISHPCGSGTSTPATVSFLAGCCDSIDFNSDGLYPDTADIDDFLSVFSGAACSTGVCGDIDFNNDGLFPDTLDIDSMLSVFSGGACL